MFFCPPPRFIRSLVPIYSKIKNVDYCQAQSQLQVKLSLKTELALFSFNPSYMWLHIPDMWLHITDMWLHITDMWLHIPPPGKVYLEANMKLAKLRLIK